MSMRDVCLSDTRKRSNESKREARRRRRKQQTVSVCLIIQFWGPVRAFLSIVGEGMRMCLERNNRQASAGGRSTPRNVRLLPRPPSRHKTGHFSGDRAAAWSAKETRTDTLAGSGAAAPISFSGHYKLIEFSQFKGQCRFLCVRMNGMGFLSDVLCRNFWKKTPFSRPVIQKILLFERVNRYLGILGEILKWSLTRLLTVL